MPSSLKLGEFASYHPSVTGNLWESLSEYIQTFWRPSSSGRVQATHWLSGAQAYWRISKAVAVSTRVTAFVSMVT